MMLCRKWFLFIPVLIVAFAGCKSIGPKTVPVDRFNYNTAISDSWKEQTLLNIVKLRYADMPLFVEVASIVSGYTLETSVDVSGSFRSSDSILGNAAGVGAGGRFTDRPTITYSPLTGRKFNQNFMTPVPPRALLFLIQSGWPADLILNLTVDSINGMRSRSHGGGTPREGDPEFYEVVDLLRKLQVAGIIGMRLEVNKEADETIIIVFHRKNLIHEEQALMTRLQELLGIDSSAEELAVHYGALAQSPNEIAILSRSMLQIMIELAVSIDVPQEHIDKKYIMPSQDPGEFKRALGIKVALEEPEDSFAAVYYMDHWFWIEHSDFESKRTFSFIMLLFSLTETGGTDGLPVVTIPAG
jgi:hypothetical protein